MTSTLSTAPQEPQTLGRQPGQWSDKAVGNTLASTEEQSARRLIEQAGNTLKERAPDIPADFAARLFEYAAPEDLIARAPVELAALAAAAWRFFSERKPGEPKIRFTAPASAAGEAQRDTYSVIEIANDDMPFLVDSVMGLLTDLGLSARLVVHPIFTSVRDASGRLERLAPEDPASGTILRESFIHIHVEPVEDEQRRADVAAALERVLGDVRIAVGDWRAMLGRIGEIVASLKANPPPLPGDEIAEAVQFLEWLVANNFTLLGIREYRVAGPEGELAPVPNSGLGVLRRPEMQELIRPGGARMAREWRALLHEPALLMVTKASIRSRVHRRVFMDYVGVKRFDALGNAIGEVRIVGLLTSSAYTLSIRNIPYLRRQVETVLARSGFNPAGHSGKALVNILETYPRDELFRIDPETLYHFAIAILQLIERPRVRVLTRRDRFDRFVSALVYLPRNRAASNVVEAIGKLFADTYRGQITSFNLFFPEGPLVRIHYIVGLSGEDVAEPDRSDMESAVEDIVRTWADALREELERVYETGQASRLFQRYAGGFSASYRDRYAPATAVEDIHTLEGLSVECPLAVHFHGRTGAGADCVGLKVWSRERPLPLSERVPVLENMGFRVVDEHTYEIALDQAGGVRVWLHDTVLQDAHGQAIDFAARKAVLEACFLAVMRGMAENDGYNALVLAEGLGWREVALIRAISRYLRQIRIAFSQDYMWATLRKHSAIAAKLMELFAARFDPRAAMSAPERTQRQTAVAKDIEAGLGKVESLDEDRILRHFVNAIWSGLRTNFYQIGADGMAKPVIAIKFDSRKIDDLPLPRPLYEIFVYSPRVEGVHLRFGKVARGGIRWSDRPQDFRTEVLGLVKAQQVKNAVIVPVGAKGGFVPKLIAAGAPRDAIQAEGIATYKLFISSLLDITDNLWMDEIVPPDNVVRHDDDDPYLVVAADKGTATFSDIANAISLERGFWLGDAFASGGSAGYDHKEMGITARGAWEAVKRHFREMDVDITRMPFTVAGIGDMSGDVFGNGMLRERTIKLVAAFDHRDIFIDPDPDPEASFNERARLFALPRSSWQDYDKSKVSAGGGVFSRTAKQIPLSAEMGARLGLEGESATPQRVMGAILRMPVDLLWFGGIGTYVRSSEESNDAAGDRANDAIRVTGAQLRCRVVGEGANLGLTQRGRVEAAMHGARLNTDAIDNSAGVNTSDVEVNIKIALSQPVRNGALTLESRNALLGEMTGEVAQLVLRNNYLQTLALSLAERRGLEDVGFLQRFMQTQEARGLLDRAVESLPDDVEIAERRRRGQGLTRPELAVLLAYAKLSLYSDLLDSPVPDDSYLDRELGRYFPKVLSERFPQALESHRLRREIISTQLANSMVNRGGPSLLVRMTDESGASVAAIALAFAAVRNSYDMPALNEEINTLDAKVPGKLQLELYAAVEDLLLDRLVWFLRNVDLSEGLAAIVAHYRDGIAAVDQALEHDESLAVAADTARAQELITAGVPERLAGRIAKLPLLAAAPDVVLVAGRTGKPVLDVARTYFAARDYFRVDPIARAARGIAVSDYFDRLALDRAREALGEGVRRLTAEMVAGGRTGRPAVEAWVALRGGDVERTLDAINEIADSGLTLSKLLVASSLLGDLAGE